MQDHLFPLGWLFSPALQRSLQSSSPNIDWCTLYAANCVHRRFLSCFFVYLFVYFLIYYSIYISSLCVFVCICLFITTLISSYFCAWPSEISSWYISEWLSSLFFFTIISFLCLNTFSIKSTIKIVVVVDICHTVIKLEHSHPWAVMTELAERLYCPIAEWTRPNHPPLQRSPARDHYGRH